jgi:hypothetical protein
VLYYKIFTCKNEACCLIQASCSFELLDITATNITMLASYTSASSAGGDDDYAFELGGYGSKKKGSNKKSSGSKHQKKSKLSFNVDSDDGYAGSAAASPTRASFSPATVASEESTGSALDKAMGYLNKYKDSSKHSSAASKRQSQQARKSARGSFDEGDIDVSLSSDEDGGTPPWRQG